MLKRITIRNFALIEHVEIDFSHGFSVVTGETGHGKSVFLGALSMLLGQRSDTKAVREGCDRCVIEGCFDVSAFSLRSFFEENDLDYDDECIIRRELTVTGRSRAFVNDTPVAVAQLKELGTKLVDIHSQHQNLLLGDKNYQLKVLDILSFNKELLASYKSEYDVYMSVRKELEALKKSLEESRRDEEWLRFQLEELQSARLKEGELEELELEIKELSHAEEIQAALLGANSALDSDDGRCLLTSLKESSNVLLRISDHYQAASELAERLESCYIELRDCCDEMLQRGERVQFAPERLEWVENRIALIYNLQKKHRVGSVAELMALEADMARRVENIVDGDSNVEALERELNNVHKRLMVLSDELTSVRNASADKFKEEITAILVNLGMPMIRFTVEISSTGDFTPMGRDAVTFLFSANSSSTLQPLNEVASGGEMARVMLALKSLVAQGSARPTLIFDEVDTGVSGVLAERMGRLMKQMGGAGCQVLSITHLPQVAALGAHHYKVYKKEDSEKGTVTNIIKLVQEERVREIAQMMSGEVLTDAAMENAALLLSKS